MKQVKVTIGIPAYNEEANIKNLLQLILKYETNDFVIDNIIIVSDGSTDKTVQKAREVNDKRIIVIDRKNRLGANLTLNEIVQFAKGEILVLLNADVIIVSPNFIEKIIQPIINNQAVGLVGANIISVKPKGLFETIMSTSSSLRNEIYRSVRNGNNIYACHGRARAVSKKLYSQLKWPTDIPEDSYSYLRCLELGYVFTYVSDVYVSYRSPGTLSDHKKQSLRFSNGKKKLEKYFSKKTVAQQFHIPFLNLFYHFMKYIFSHPVETILYSLVTLYLRIKYNNIDIDQSKWEISASSKKVLIS